MCVCVSVGGVCPSGLDLKKLSSSEDWHCSAVVLGIEKPAWKKTEPNSLAVHLKIFLLLVQFTHTNELMQHNS